MAREAESAELRDGKNRSSADDASVCPSTTASENSCLLGRSRPSLSAHFCLLVTAVDSEAPALIPSMRTAHDRKVTGSRKRKPTSVPAPRLMKFVESELVSISFPRQFRGKLGNLQSNSDNAETCNPSLGLSSRSTLSVLCKTLFHALSQAWMSAI